MCFPGGFIRYLLSKYLQGIVFMPATVVILNDNFVGKYHVALQTQCCIAGGGPAGIMLGFILARAGAEVIILEKHADFFRDFRGDTIHPSTFQIIHELGLLSEFLALPHQELQELRVIYNGIDFKLADFTHLPVVKKAIGFMPQWDLLNFFVKQAKKYPTFHLMLETEATDLLLENNKVVGVRAIHGGKAISIRSQLSVCCDGRSSVLREKAGLQINSIGAPINVLWFRLSKKTSDPTQAVLGRFHYGKIMVMIERDTYYQIGYIIEKGTFAKKQQEGLEAFKAELVLVAGFLKDRVDELKDWTDIKLLTVTIDRLKRWYREGLLCIGDAAHAMSPIGGVGINLAIQDAVAAANILSKALLNNNVQTALLQKVQNRRQFPTEMTQKLQVFIQKGIVDRRKEQGQNKMPLLFRLIKRFPLLCRIPARLVGLGFRPEHVQVADIKK